MAPMYFEQAAKAIVYAKTLAASPDEKNHREESLADPRASVLEFGKPVSGRFGFGDTKTGAGKYVETFALAVVSKSRVAIDAVCDPCWCDVSVTRPDGKQINSNRDFNDPFSRKFNKSIDPGTYKVEILTDKPGDVGTYTLTASLLK